MEFVTITLAEYEKLVDTATRVKILADTLSIKGRTLYERKEILSFFGIREEEETNDG